MFNKLKANVASAAAGVEKKVADHQDAARLKEEEKWRGEVLLGSDQKLFKDWAGWDAVYNPKKQGSASSADDANSVTKAVVAKIAENLHKTVMEIISTVLGKLLGPAEAAIKSAQKDLSEVLNAANGAVLSYAFASKLGEKRQAYFRGLAASRLVKALSGAMSAEAAVLGVQMGESIDAAHVQKIVDGVVAKVEAEIEKQKAAAVAAIKGSPMFAMSGADGAQLDAGVLALQGFLQSYLESKIGEMLKTLTAVLKKLLELAAKHQKAIVAQLKAKAGEAESGDFKKSVDEAQKVMEEAYGTLHGAVAKYVDDVVILLTNVNYKDGKAMHADPNAK